MTAEMMGFSSLQMMVAEKASVLGQLILKLNH